MTAKPSRYFLSLLKRKSLLFTIYTFIAVLACWIGWLWYVNLFPDGRIIYKEKRGSGTVLVTVKPNGEKGRVLLDDFQWRPLTNFSVSPDGNLVAFASYDDPRLNIEDRTTNIYVVHEEISVIATSFYETSVLDYTKAPKIFCDGAKERNVVFDNITWSPEGRRLAFTCPFMNAASIQSQLVCTTDMESNINCWDVSSILKDTDYKGRLSFVSWSPKSEQLMVQFTHQELSKDGSYYVIQNLIYLVSPDGEDSMLLTNGHGGGWSPDGQRIAYFSYEDSKDSETFYIYSINIDGTNKKNLFTYRYEQQLAYHDKQPGNWLSVDILGYIAPSGQITWSPDGRNIAFTATKTTMGLNPSIYVLNILSKRLTWISVVGGGLAENPVWIQ